MRAVRRSKEGRTTSVFARLFGAYTLVSDSSRVVVADEEKTHRVWRIVTKGNEPS